MLIIDTAGHQEMNLTKFAIAIGDSLWYHVINIDNSINTNCS